MGSSINWESSPDMSHQEPPTVHQLTFIGGDDNPRSLNAENASRHRKAIFTEAERQRMSDALARVDANHRLLDLDRSSLHLSQNVLFSQFHGPFGVFRLTEYKPGPGAVDAASATEIPEIESPMSLPDAWLDVDAAIDSIEQGDGNNPSVSFDASTIFLLDQVDVGSSSTQVSQLFDIELPTADPIDVIQPTPFPCLSTGGSSSWLLLSHYKEKIIRLSSPTRNHDKSPWAKLVMPCAMSTLAELQMGGTPNNARMALLNGLLATSAFHIQHNSSSSLAGGEVSGEYYAHLAESHLEQCMDGSGSLSTARGKYKEILMAALSLSNAFMIKGDPDTQLVHLLHAERFINTYGFKKNVLSSKRRALHHCYAYMRIMAETTVFPDHSNNEITEYSLGDSRVCNDRFRATTSISWTDDTMATEKDPWMAQRDLHLAIPGRWGLTLFPELYGVTETFLMLLSQIVRLANERDLTLANPVPGRNVLGLRDFSIWAKALEKATRMLLASCSTELGDQSSSPNSGPMAQVMYTALLIFLYRRVYDVDATLLQKEVQQIQSLLMQIQQEDGSPNDSTSTALIWPAFIAASEATELDSQVYFSLWFDSTSKTTGLVSASLAKKIAETIWTKRRNATLCGGACSWPELLRAREFRFMSA